jgi:N-methylhydantoinase A
VVFDRRKISTNVYRGGELNPGASFEGPAIIEEPTTTIVIPPACGLSVNEFGDYELTLASEQAARTIAAAS